MNDSNNKEINQYQKKKGIRTKHGFWKITDNGLLTSEGNYKYGRKHGLWKEWYANGQLKFKGKYSTPKETSFQNTKNELWEEWYENGQLKSKGFFHEGIEVGTHKTWHENGILSQETFYDIEKNLQQRGYFASPKKNKKWFKNGKLKSKGLLFFNHYKEWYQNGSQKRETINARSNSSGNGFKKEWYENNQIKKAII